MPSDQEPNKSNAVDETLDMLRQRVTQARHDAVAANGRLHEAEGSLAHAILIAARHRKDASRAE